MTEVQDQPPKVRSPLYPRLLRLRHIAPNAWQRALLGEGALALAALLVLADLATAWTLLVLPLAVALVVKAHDLLAGRLEAPASSGTADGRVINARTSADPGPGSADPAALITPDSDMRNGADPEGSTPQRRMTS